MTYLLPLGSLVYAMLTRQRRIVPVASSLQEFFPTYPATTLRNAIAAMVETCNKRERANDAKARYLYRATILVAVATTVLLVTQFVVAVL